MKPHILISCEHGGNDVPPRYRPLFTQRSSLLTSHRGFDVGALDLAQAIGRELGLNIHFSTVTRLLIDLNRSLHNPTLFSEITSELPADTKQHIIALHYEPYRSRIQSEISTEAARGIPTMHFSIHTFAPTLNGAERNTDFAFLYDPARPKEKTTSLMLYRAIKRDIEGLKIRLNYPYRGTSDGLTTYLRRSFSSELYLGIEIEVNQRHPLGNDRLWEEIVSKVPKTFKVKLSGEIPCEST